MPKNETEVQSRWRAVLRTLVLRAVLIEVVVAVASLALGGLFAGSRGLAGAGIGAGIAAVFLLLSVVIMYFGRDLDVGILGGLLGLAFIVKAFILMIMIWAIKDAQWLSGPVAFFTIIAAVLLTTVLEVLTMLKARVPYVDPEAGRDAH
ncbi:hypothetical protein NQ036_08590 [Brevibacterium sp. 91QC2O2]|uniref:hypothetical protein n=1 Tax=Brevibacterium sp. 91QC2O2 TaxID=2968458 RepID=UPI00211D11DE|nr:hypothetical protein [Brevibacterium sp. 91QC2O2]MCQ9368294.1 hypothetical protein [Brevibacterium sp. 91QC2O2]